MPKIATAQHVPSLTAQTPCLSETLNALQNPGSCVKILTQDSLERKLSKRLSQKGKQTSCVQASVALWALLTQTAPLSHHSTHNLTLPEDLYLCKETLLENTGFERQTLATLHSPDDRMRLFVFPDLSALLSVHIQNAHRLLPVPLSLSASIAVATEHGTCFNTVLHREGRVSTVQKPHLKIISAWNKEERFGLTNAIQFHEHAKTQKLTKGSPGETLPQDTQSLVQQTFHRILNDAQNLADVFSNLDDTPLLNVWPKTLPWKHEVRQEHRDALIGLVVAQIKPHPDTQEITLHTHNASAHRPRFVTAVTQQDTKPFVNSPRPEGRGFTAFRPHTASGV